MTATGTTTTQEVRLGGLVGRRIATLQALQVAGRSQARAVMAHLRAAINLPPGSDPAIWSVTAVYDDDRGLPDAPTPEETAVHLALCLWAIHQQSRDKPMHQAGTPFATAVAELSRRRSRDTGTDPVRHRFDAVVTSTGVSEAAHHLRGLVTQMRSGGLAFDYGALAEDLADLQRPGGRERVARRWARQYHRTTAPTDNPTSDTKEN